MNRLFRWYNQNREQVIIAIAIIAFALIIIHTLNAIIGRENEQKKNNNLGVNSSTNNSTTISKTDTSVITGDKILSEDNNINTNLIKEFFDYCNSGEVEKAYNMISEECKSLFYPTVKDFKKNYYDNIFYMKRMYSLENWFNTSTLYTYYIKYSDDILEAGTTKSSNNKSDYITISKDNDGYYLNINSFIGRNYRNTEMTKQDIVFTVKYVDMYIDYTIVNFSVTNNTNNTICIDTREAVNTTYLYDEKNVKYTAFLNENADELIVRAGMTNTINIKFNKMYNTERAIYGVVFNDITLNYESYKTDASNKVAINVDIRV